MSVSNPQGELVTYAGGCGPRHVDINPQFKAQVNIPITISAALYDEHDQEIASTHGPFYNKGSVYPGVWIKDARWVADVPAGGKLIKVFLEFVGESMLTDHIHVET